MKTNAQTEPRSTEKGKPSYKEKEQKSVGRKDLIFSTVQTEQYVSHSSLLH